MSLTRKPGVSAVLFLEHFAGSTTSGALEMEEQHGLPNRCRMQAKRRVETRPKSDRCVVSVPAWR